MGMGFLKIFRKKETWVKMGKAALIATELVPGGTLIGKTLRVVRDIHTVENADTKLTGEEKKEIVLSRVGDVDELVASAFAFFIDAYVSAQNAIAALGSARKALVAAWAAAKAKRG